MSFQTQIVKSSTFKFVHFKSIVHINFSLFVHARLKVTKKLVSSKLKPAVIQPVTKTLKIIMLSEEGDVRLPAQIPECHHKQLQKLHDSMLLRCKSRDTRTVTLASLQLVVLSKFLVIGGQFHRGLQDIIRAGSGLPVHSHELGLEDQSGPSGDLRRGAIVAIAKLGRDLQLPLLPDAHSEDTLVPALDHGALSELEVQRLPSAVALVEQRPVGECAAVVDAHLVSLVRLQLAALGLEFHPNLELRHRFLRFRLDCDRSYRHTDNGHH
jgi:hypothetical protein